MCSAFSGISWEGIKFVNSTVDTYRICHSDDTTWTKHKTYTTQKLLCCRPPAYELQLTPYYHFQCCARVYMPVTYRPGNRLSHQLPSLHPASLYWAGVGQTRRIWQNLTTLPIIPDNELDRLHVVSGNQPNVCDARLNSAIGFTVLHVQVTYTGLHSWSLLKLLGDSFSLMA